VLAEGTPAGLKADTGKDTLDEVFLALTQDSNVFVPPRSTDTSTPGGPDGGLRARHDGGPRPARSLRFSGLAAGVLADAVIIRSAIAPSLILVLGRANWWFPRRLGRMLPPVTAGEAAKKHH
jgi:hypothetical protein